MRDDTPGGQRSEQALRAAQLYYLQHQTMETIARDLGVSRSSVSRLLAHARDTGIVDIRVRAPHGHAGDLEQRLREGFGVEPHVVPVPDDITDVDRLERVAVHAAHLFSGYVESSMVVGVAWGSTLSAISKHLPPKPTRNTTIVQLNGAGNTHDTGIEYSSEILQRFGTAYGARVQQFPVPAFFDQASTKEALWRERSIRRLLELQSRADLAIFGVGTPYSEVPSHVYIGGYLAAPDYRSLKEARAVGDVATVFFREDGSFEDIELNARSSGPRLSLLRRVPRRICVASGSLKLAGVRGALAAGLATDLVVDEQLARRLVAP